MKTILVDNVALFRTTFPFVVLFSIFITSATIAVAADRVTPQQSSSSWTPLKLTLVYASSFPKTSRVKGISLGLLNEDEYVAGGQFGILGGGTGKLRGFQFGTIYVSGWDVKGIQSSLFVTLSQGKGLFPSMQIAPFNFGNEVAGAQLGAANRADMMKGLQLGLLCSSSEDFTGVQLSLYNEVTRHRESGGNGRGLQLGVINRVGGSFHGVQIGVFNSAQVLRGLQIGVINCVMDRQGIGKVLPLVNFGW